MKNLFLTAVFLLSALCVNAQQVLTVESQYPGDQKAQQVYQTAVDKQSNNASAVRTTWLSNKPNSNWFISLEGGVSQVFDEKYKDYPFEKNIKPTGGIALGKWFSPVWGLRISASGGKLSGWDQSANGIWYVGQGAQIGNTGSYVIGDTPAKRQAITDRFLTARDGDVYNDFSYANVTADFLLNLKNLFLPYNPKGFFNPVLYGGVGYVHTFGSGVDPFSTTKKGRDDLSYVPNLGLKGGLQLNFRLCDSWNIYLAGEGLLVPENFDRYIGGKQTYEGVASVKLGLTYRFNFRHFVKAPLYDQSEVDALNREINELRNRPNPVCPPVVVCPEVPKPAVVEKKEGELDPVFFLINSAAVRDNQLVNVAKAAEYMISHPGAKLELASYADKKTGNPSYNMQLSKKRTDAVANVLVNKFGIDKKRLILKHYGDTVQPFAENDWNRVTIFIK